MSTTTPEFAQAIALECQALETIFARETQNYYETPELLGKRWYAIGLESIDSEKQKDGANKSTVVKRMLDAVINFIKRLLTRIADYLKGCKARGEQSAKNSNYYTEESTNKSPRASAGDTEEELQIWAQKAVKKLSKTELNSLYAMMDKEFNSQYRDSYLAVYRLLSKPSTIHETIPERAAAVDTLMVDVRPCMDAFKEAQGVSNEEKAQAVAEILANVNECKERLKKNYGGGDLLVNDCAIFVGHVLVALQKMQKDTSNHQDAELVKDCQKLIVEVGHLTTFFSTTHDAYIAMMYILY